MKLISLTPCCCIGLLPYADSLVMSLLNPEMELPSLSNSDGFNLLKTLNGIILAIAPQSTLHLTSLAGPVQLLFLSVEYMLT